MPDSLTTFVINPREILSYIWKEGIDNLTYGVLIS